MLKNLDSNIISELTKAELEILRFIELNSEDIIKMSIQECAKKNFTSTATILRLCKKIGLTGFSELKFLLKQELDDEKPNVLKNKNTLSIINETFINLENTIRLLNSNELERVINLLLSDKKIHLYAGGFSSFAMEYLEKYLLSLGRQVVFYQTAPLAYRAANNMSENDIIIIASTSGATPPIIKITQLAKKSKALIIAISNFSNNPLAELADICFYIFSDERNYYGTDIKSRLGLFIIVNMIMESYLYKIQQKEELEE